MDNRRRQVRVVIVGYIIAAAVFMAFLLLWIYFDQCRDVKEQLKGRDYRPSWEDDEDD